MNIPEWAFYLGAFISFWVGYFTSAMLSSSKEEDIRAAILGELGATSKREHGEGVHQGTDTQGQKVTVSDILSKPKASTRKTEASKNGTQKRVVKNV